MGWRHRILFGAEAQRATGTAALEATYGPELPAPEARGVLPRLGQATGAFIRRMYGWTPNPFAWLVEDPPALRMPPEISGGTTVSPPFQPPGLTNQPVAQYPLYRRRRH